MNFVILDLEWNGTYSRRLKGFMNEIIEFGAVKVDECLHVLDTFGACIVKTLFAGIIYTCAFIIIIYIRPTLLGISRDSMLNVLRGRKK